ncbi:MAG: PDZ domain-containing protein [Ignavibacteria bacterium]|nr:PDZ domain-containing protein [Ignavibacteria bacterium]
MIRIFLSIFVFNSFAVAQLEVFFNYHISISNPKSEIFEIELHTPMIDSQTITFGIPVWSPGSYSINNYWEKIQNLQAFDSLNNELEIIRLDSIRWQINNAQSLNRLSYQVKDFDDADFLDTSELDSTFGYYNGTAIYLIPIGYENYEFQVKFFLQDSWSIETSLDSISPNCYKAKNYDELADSPVMLGNALKRWDFAHTGIDFSLIVQTSKDFFPDSTIAVIKEIINAQTKFFSDTPITKYKFLFYFNEDSDRFRGFYGALEHLQSSVYYLPYIEKYELDIRNNFIGSTISHELFHIWNVKLLRPKELQSFNYFEPVNTNLLWFSEGVTEYYSNLLMVRNRIIKEEKFWEEIINKIEESGFVQYLDGGSSLAEISANAAYNSFYSLYSKGTLFAFYLDLKIRKLTDNVFLLDDVIKILYEGYGKKQLGFTENDLITIINSLTRTDFHDFFKDYIHSSIELPHDYFLSLVGLTRKGLRPYFGIHFFLNDSDETAIDYIEENSPASKAGIKENDILLRINDFELNSIENSDTKIDSITQFLHELPAESSVTFYIKRKSKTISVHVNPILKERELSKLVNSENMSYEQKRFREKLLYGK